MDHIRVEQWHASAAIVARMHPMAGLDSVAQRSLCHSAKPLLQDPDQEALQRKIGALESRLQRLCKKTGSGISGRQMFMQDLARGCHVVKGQPVSHELKEWSMQQHSVLYQNLSDRDKELYNGRAEKHREAMREANLQTIADLRQ